MARLTGSDLICKSLKLEGVKNIFGLAGDHILPLLNTMIDQDFRIIDTRHEQAAVHMADAWSRITEQPGVCMYTTPGFANAIPGLTNAMHTEGAVISIAGCADTHDLGRGAQQEIEQVAMAAPICKGSFMVPDARRIPEFIACAVRLAFSGRRGPVHLTIPIDVQEQSVDENEIVFTLPEEYRPKESVLGNAALVRRAIAVLREARRPLAIAGCAAGYTLSGEALRRFIETTRVPVVTEEQARGLVSDDHPYVFGFFERGLNRVAGKVRDADVVVLLGRKQDFVIGFCRPPHVSADAKIIQIDPSPLEIGRNRGVGVWRTRHAALSDPGRVWTMAGLVSPSSRLRVGRNGPVCSVLLGDRQNVARGDVHRCADGCSSRQFFGAAKLQFFEHRQPPLRVAVRRTRIDDRSGHAS